MQTIQFNISQKQAFSTFFNNLAVAWFVALFASPTIARDINWLTLIQYLVNMFLALFVSIYLLKE